MLPERRSRRSRSRHQRPRFSASRTFARSSWSAEVSRRRTEWTWIKLNKPEQKSPSLAGVRDILIRRSGDTHETLLLYEDCSYNTIPISSFNLSAEMLSTKNQGRQIEHMTAKWQIGRHDEELFLNYDRPFYSNQAV